MKRLWSLVTWSFGLAVLAGAATAPAETAAAAKGAPPSIEEKTAGMRKLDGYVPLYWDTAEGRLYLEIDRLGVELLHSNGFASGLGSNDIGIDRGALAGSRIVTFERVGPKLLMVQPNYDFRASSSNAEEVRAVKDAFARSVLWGFGVAAETGGRVLVDATDWLLRDNLNLATRLRPGSYKLDEKRSSLYMAGTFNFPKNTEIEVELTYVLQQPSDPPRGGAAPGPGADYASSCPTPSTGRARSTRAPATSTSRTRSVRRGSASRSSGASSRGIGSRSGTRRRRSPTSRSRSSTTSTRGRPSPSAPLSSRARAGGRRLSRPRASRTRSAWSCDQRTSTRSTPATT
jgi:hypothetical protein